MVTWSLTRAKPNGNPPAGADCRIEAQAGDVPRAIAAPCVRRPHFRQLAEMKGLTRLISQSPDFTVEGRHLGLWFENFFMPTHKKWVPDLSGRLNLSSYVLKRQVNVIFSCTLLIPPTRDKQTIGSWKVTERVRVPFTCAMSGIRWGTTVSSITATIYFPLASKITYQHNIP